MVKVNVDDAPSLAAKYGVVSIPTIAYFDKGRLVDTFIGAASKDALAQGLAKLVPSA